MARKRWLKALPAVRTQTLQHIALVSTHEAGVAGRVLRLFHLNRAKYHEEATTP